MPDKNIDTVEFREQETLFGPKEPELDVEIVACTHPGKKRKRNEDHYAVIERKRSSKMLLSNLPNPDAATDCTKAYGLLVADGIGGAPFGDYASQFAIETILHSANLATSWLMKYGDTDHHESTKRVSAYINRIQDAFKHQGETHPSMAKMGTTLTVAYLLPPHVILSHVGDSRAYLFRDGIIHQLTRDQTLAQALIDGGLEKDKVARFGHVLINSLGCGLSTVDADVHHIDVQPGDRLLLCSDGLTDMVNTDSIAKTLGSTKLPEICDRLIGQAMDGGGKDNITVIVAEFKKKSA